MANLLFTVLQIIVTTIRDIFIERKNRVKSLIYIIIPFVIIIFITLTFFGIFELEISFEWSCSIIVICIITLGIALARKNKACSYCKKWGALVVYESNQIGSEEVSFNRTVKDPIKDKDGKGTQYYAERTERVYATDITYDVTYKCTICGNFTQGKQLTRNEH